MIDAFTQGVKVGLNGLGLLAPFALIFMAYHGYKLTRSYLDRSKRISALQTHLRAAQDLHERSTAEMAAIERVLDDHGAAKVERGLTGHEGPPMSTARRVRVALEAKR